MTGLGLQRLPAQAPAWADGGRATHRTAAGRDGQALAGKEFPD